MARTPSGVRAILLSCVALRLRTPTFRRRATKSPSAPPRHSNNDQPVPRRTGSESQAIAPLRLFNLRQPPRSLHAGSESRASMGGVSPPYFGFRVPSDSPASSFQLAPAASVSYTRVQSPKRQRPMELSAPRLHVSNTRHDVKEIKQCILPRSISANFNLIIYDFSATMDYK